MPRAPSSTSARSSKSSSKLIESFVKVGKVKDAHGIRGELYVVLFAGEADWLKKFKQARLVIESNPSDIKTYQVKSARVHKSGLIVKTEEIKDRNEAETLKGRVLEIPEAFLIAAPGEQPFLREILGFHVVTAEQGDVGEIVKFSSNVAQDLLVVKSAKGEYEIPFVEAFVKKVDYQAKTVEMQLPYGLLGEDDENDEDHGDEGDEN